MPIYRGTDRIKNIRENNKRVAKAYVGYVSVVGPKESDAVFNNIDHYYYATDAKFGGPGLPFDWKDTGVVGGADIPYVGTQAVFVTLNSDSGSYISTTNDAAYYDATAIAATTDFSFRFWIRSSNDTTAGAKYFLQYGSGASDEIFTIRQSRLASVEYIYLDSDTISAEIKGSLPVNTWTMFTVTYEGATKTFKMYKNKATLLGTETLGAAGPTFGPELRLLDATLQDNWNADTKSFSWYKRLLSEEDITRAYEYDLANNF